MLARTVLHSQMQTPKSSQLPYFLCIVVLLRLLRYCLLCLYEQVLARFEALASYNALAYHKCILLDYFKSTRTARFSLCLQIYKLAIYEHLHSACHSVAA